MRYLCRSVLTILAVIAAARASCTLSTTLRSVASSSGVYMGTCIGKSYLSVSSYASTAKTQFNLVTPENECKMDATEPTQGTFSYTACDAILSFATTNSMAFRGHALVWGEQYPSWVSSLSSSGKLSAMTNHIKNVLTHFKGSAYAWDVVNEAVSDSSASLKSTVWYPYVSDYINQAFTAARAADSSTKLFYNDYSIDGVNTKSTYVYTMIKTMLSSSIPIDGIGFQMHISTSYYPTQSDMTTNFKRFAALGLEIHITELDVGVSSSSEYDTQAKIFGYALNACLAVSKCKSFEVWGVTDAYTWRTGKLPLLFDSSYAPKAAACTVRSIFAAAAGSTNSTACTLSSTLPTGASAMGTCSTSVKSGSSCSYTCSSGYTAVAGTCNTGTWTTTPSCSSSGSCSISALPTGASGWGTCSSKVSSGSSCSYTCSDGYTASSGTCSSGSWKSTPSCSANSCTLSSLPSSASGWGTCSSTVKSGSTCALSCPSSTTKVTGVCYAGSWNPSPSCSSGCTVNKSCSTTQVCGSIWNGCATVSCGNCSTGYYCNGTSCLKLDTVSEWTQTYPDSYTSLNWRVDSYSRLILTNYTLASTPRFLAYSGPQTSWFTSYITITVLVRASDGSVNFGLRLNQGSSRKLDRIGWKLTISSGKASSSFCRTYNGPPETCTSATSSLSFSSGSFHNFTINFQFGSDYITSNAWLDSTKLSSSDLSETASHFPNTGSLFIVTQNSASEKVFQDLIVRSKTAVHATLLECTSVSTWNAIVANLLGISASSVSSRVVGSDAYCGATSKKRSGMVPFEIETLIPDDEVTMTPSSSLADIFQSAINDGALLSNQVAVTSVETTVPTVEAGEMAFTNIAVLSAGAIVGIAIGCAVAGLLVGTAVVGTAAVVLKRHSAPAEVQEQPKRKSFLARTFGRDHGVDVMGNDPTAVHTSITNRAPPVAL